LATDILNHTVHASWSAKVNRKWAGRYCRMGRYVWESREDFWTRNCSKIQRNEANKRPIGGI